MAGKVSTLTWDAPPNGGSDITSYRVLVYEADQQVDTLTSDQPGVQVTASETVERTALIQALNDLGYSAPALLAIPAASDTLPTAGLFVCSGGGALQFAGVSGTPVTPGTPVPPTITVTRVDETHSRIAFASPGDGAYAQVRVLLNGTTINGATAPGDVTTVSGQHTIQLKLLYGSNYNYATPLSNLVTVPAYVAPSDPSPSYTTAFTPDGPVTDFGWTGLGATTAAQQSGRFVPTVGGFGINYGGATRAVPGAETSPESKTYDVSYTRAHDSYSSGGLVFRIVSDTQFWFMDGNNIGFASSGSFQTIYNISGGLHDTVRLVISPTQITAYVNGTVQFTADNDLYHSTQSGRAGLWGGLAPIASAFSASAS